MYRVWKEIGVFMEDVFKNNLTELAKKIGIDLDELQVKKYYDYMNILLEWNEKINLTAITEMNDVILKHFIDCITVMKYINEKSNILDVGSGAGFPGIPISILDTESSITLLDSLNKRVIFLQEVIKRLDLNNVSAIHSRAEEFGRNKLNREKNSSSKKFYIIIKNIQKEKEEINILELNEKYFKIKECLARCGNVVQEILNEEELKDILFSFFNTRKNLM